MPRIRTVKPEFWFDQKMACLSIPARLVFIGLLNHADDAGRFAADLRLVKGAIFPLNDDITLDDIRRWLDELSSNTRVRLYENDGTEYGDIPKFNKHQKIDKPSPSRRPPFDDPSSKPRLGLAVGREGKGREEDKSTEPEKLGSILSVPNGNGLLPGIHEQPAPARKATRTAKPAKALVDPDGPLNIPWDLKDAEPEIREWLRYKRDMFGFRYLETSWPSFLKFMQSVPVDVAKAGIVHAIASGWKGIHWDKAGEEAAAKALTDEEYYNERVSMSNRIERRKNAESTKA